MFGLGGEGGSGVGAQLAWSHSLARLFGVPGRASWPGEASSRRLKELRPCCTWLLDGWAAPDDLSFFFSHYGFEM